MERPAKRPRFGAAPFEEEDPDEDELVSRPEEVNARRDPGLRFERSRAFAAFKLKSAFESIFEKYGKDFTGVGDEIDLRTGEIVVNNGHIQSLKNAVETQQDDDEDDEDTTSDSTPLNEEPSGQESQQDSLGRRGQPSSSFILPELPSDFPQQLPPPPLATTPSFHGEGSPGIPTTMGYPPIFTHMMCPGRMPHGAFSMYPPMPYSGPIPMPMADLTWQIPEMNSQMQPGAANPVPMANPTWQFPELPVSAFDSKEPHVAPTRKKARQLVTIVREDSSDVEDDILGKGAPNANHGQSREHPEEALVKKKVLLPRPVSEKTSVTKKKGRALSKQSQEEAALPKMSAGEESSTTKNSRRGRPRLEKSASTPPGGVKSIAKPIAKSHADSHEPLLVELTPSALNNRVTARNSHLLSTQEREDSSTRSIRKTKSLPIRQQQMSKATPVPAKSDEAIDAEVYIDLSNPETKLARKPQNQSLRVEIVSKKSIDIASFRAITPDASEIASDSPDLVKGDGEPTELAAQNSSMGESDAEQELAIEGEKATRSSRSFEVFSRNTIDVDYSFSDEDEPLPQRRQPHQVPVEAEKALNASRVDVEATAKAIPSESPACEETQPTETLPSTEEVAPLWAEDVHQEHATDPIPGVESRSGHKELPITPKMSSPKVSLPSRAASITAMVRTKLASGRLPTAPRLEIPDSDPVGDPSTQKTFSQPGRGPSPTLSFQGDHEPAAEIPNSDALVSPSGTRVQDDTAFHHTQPSPTLSCTGVESSTPTPKADPASTVISSPSKPANKPDSPSKKVSPSTPIKTPPSQTTRKPPSDQDSSAKPLTTTATTASAKRKNNILSLLSDSEDELSMASPITQKTPATTRSSPASHHVRLFSSFPAPVPSALKRDALMNSASKAAARTHTPGTVSKSGRKSKVISGSASGRRSISTLGMNASRSTPSKTPAGGLGDDLSVQTPGGTIRRCGEDGFRCERDFCFGCL